MIHQSVAKIISWNMDGEAVCASAAKMSTTLGNANEIFEKTKNNPQNTALIKKVLCSGHKSVIEHAVFSIAFWDVSAFVEQFLIECRLASFTVKSRRYVDFSNLGYFVPPDLSDISLARYCEYMDLLFEGYKTLLSKGIPKEDARFLLPYSFCSNFYCTLNARELGHLICSIKYGRGRNVPELQNLAQQLIEQVSSIFPALLSEFEKKPSTDDDSNEMGWFSTNDSIKMVDAKSAGKVSLLYMPNNPMEILKLAFTVANPNSDQTFDVASILASDRPRELEQLMYTYTVSDITLSGITHLVRHRMQSIIIPSIKSIDHSRCIIPDSIQQCPDARDDYAYVLSLANEKLAQIREDKELNQYSYYFTISGNMMDVMTTMNARELMLFIGLRACNRAQWEIREIATNMLKLLQKNCPELFNHYGPACVLNGYCPEGRLSCGKMAEVEKTFQKMGGYY